jgi:hypothetical protein
MGVSFRIMPGLRISASSRGIRAGVGPRIARVHVGAGRTGVSTGLGPFGAYTSLRGGRRAAPRRAFRLLHRNAPSARQSAGSVSRPPSSLTGRSSTTS